MKNNSFSIISLAVSVISLLASGYIICSENRFNADWYAIVIGVLSLLVTVLIGWNIYTVIDFKRRIDDETESLNKSFEEKALEIKSDAFNEMSKMKSEIIDYAHVNFAIIFTNIGHSLMASNMYYSAIPFFVKSIIYASVDTDKEKISSNMENMLKCIYAIKKNRNTDNGMNKDMIDLCLKEIAKIEKSETSIILKFISSLSPIKEEVITMKDIENLLEN